MKTITLSEDHSLLWENMRAADVPAVQQAKIVAEQLDTLEKQVDEVLQHLNALNDQMKSRQDRAFALIGSAHDVTIAGPVFAVQDKETGMIKLSWAEPDEFKAEAPPAPPPPPEAPPTDDDLPKA